MPGYLRTGGYLPARAAHGHQGWDHGMGTHIFPGRGPCHQVPLPEAPYKVDVFLAAVFERHTCIHSLTVQSNSSRTTVLLYGLIYLHLFWALVYILTVSLEYAITSGPW